MRKNMWPWVKTVGAIVVLVALIHSISAFRIGANRVPGPKETYVATKAVHFLVAREVAHEGLRAPTAVDSGSIERGRGLFHACCASKSGCSRGPASGAMCSKPFAPASPGLQTRPVSMRQGCGGSCYISCAMCHGSDGKTPPAIGRSLYPPAPSLATDSVQTFSDAGLFVIVKNGIALTGMPGYGNFDTDGQIWDIVHYIRSLPPPAPNPAKR